MFYQPILEMMLPQALPIFRGSLILFQSRHTLQMILMLQFFLTISDKFLYDLAPYCLLKIANAAMTVPDESRKVERDNLRQEKFIQFRYRIVKKEKRDRTTINILSLDFIEF